jgi:signal transduction histidine kinase
MNVKLDPIMDEKTSLQMARVGRAVDRMTHQIDDVLDYVNVSDLQLEKHSLSTIIESSILNTNVPGFVDVILPKNSSTIVCDAYKLEIVFSNIINNSVQAFDGEEGKITISIENKPHESIVKITDSGPGIPENVLPKIFEPLFTTKQVGTGLGLASCQSIVQKHGGTITVENNPTTFIVRLPKTQDSDKRKESEFNKLHAESLPNSIKSEEIQKVRTPSKKS